MIDLHTHLLPGIDDGSKNLEETRQLLLRQTQNGVDRVVLTPHFYCDRMDLDDFLIKRDRAFQQTLTILDPATMPQIKAGAEVRYSPALLEMDLSKLTLGESSYLLLELSDLHYPAHLEQVIMNMTMMGITPILAHLERCKYFREQPDLLLHLIGKGALGQVTVLSLFDRATKSFALACLKNSLAHIVASDAHNLTLRPPCMGKLNEIIDPTLIHRFELFAKSVWDNEEAPFFEATPVKKRVFGYS